MQWLRLAVLAIVVAGAVFASPTWELPRTDGEEEHIIRSTDPNVHTLTIPSSAAGKVLAFNYGNPAGSEKIAAFDLDGTLTNPLGHPRSISNGASCIFVECGGEVCPDDVWNSYREWRFTFGDQIRAVFQNLTANGYKIVIISNQSPLTYSTSERTDLLGRDVPAATPADKKEMWVDKLTELCQVLNGGATGDAPEIPLQVVALLDNSLKSGYYKPCSAVWSLIASNFNGGVSKIDCQNSFYSGDADARLVGDTTNPWQGGADRRTNGAWSASDGQFAISSGIPFFTPEQIFLGYPAPTPSQLHQESFEEDWCNKGDPTPWCQ